MMQKVDIKDLTPRAKFMLVAALKVALQLRQEGYDKDKYTAWCKSVWETMELDANKDLEKMLDGIMERDIKEYMECARVNGHCGEQRDA
jgi:hypothetical protein